MRHLVPTILSITALLAFSSCQRSDRPKLYPVTGTITYDGKPLADATVTFLPENGKVAVGATDASGNYTLSTQGEPGAMEGLFRISIVAMEQVKKYTPEEFEQLTDAERAKAHQSRIPTRYANPNGTELTATVTAAGPNNFSFNLEK
jgi:hypothetical protein